MSVREVIYWAGEFTDKELDAEADIGLLFWEANELANGDMWRFFAFVNSV